MDNIYYIHELLDSVSYCRSFWNGWVLALKFSNNFSNLLYTALVVVFMILSLVFLSVSFKSIPMGTAYACWTAIGAVGVIVFGMMFRVNQQMF